MISRVGAVLERCLSHRVDSDSPSRHLAGSGTEDTNEKQRGHVGTDVHRARIVPLSRTQVLSARLAFRNSLSMSFPASEIESLRAVWREGRRIA